MKKEKILLVEDDQDLQTIVSYNLEKAGFDVTRFADGHQAMQWLRQNEADLVILDLMLPGMNGDELYTRLRGEGKLEKTPVIVTTARADDETKRNSYRLGAAMVFRKPFSPTRLVKHTLAALAGVRRPVDLAAAH